MDLINFDVYINEDLIITIQTDRESAERAYRDSIYLQEITNQELEKLNMKTANDVNLLCNDINSLQTNNESNNENENDNVEQLSYEERNVSVWAPNDIHLLLTIYKEKEVENERVKQGQFWEIVAKEVNRVNPKISKTAIQCSNKIAGLKRTYKNIKDHNNKSGNNRRTWSFYEEMDEIFSNRAWVSPKNLASEIHSSQLLSSSSTSSLASSSTPTKSYKRKRDVLLEELINETKVHYEEKKVREEKKLEMFTEFRKERMKMHDEKISVQQKMLDMMTKLYSRNKE